MQGEHLPQPLAQRGVAPEDVIVLAGKGHETYQILGTEKIHLDEREVVRAYLERER